MKRNQTQSAELITFRDVTLQLRDRRILEHINWSIRDNEHWAVVGANGSGKSVLARALHGGVPVVGGEIVYHFLDDGEPRTVGKKRLAPDDLITHVSFEEQRQLIAKAASFYQSRWNSIEDGPVPTASSILFDATRDNVSHERRLRPQRSQTRFSRGDLLRRFGLNSLVGRKITSLSNGEMRKLLIARALLRRPMMLILDAPFVGLDYPSRRTLGKMIDDLMQTGTRLVFVTSHADEIPRSITNVLWLEGGTIRAAGSRESVMRALSSRKALICRSSTSLAPSPPARFRSHAFPTPRVLVEIKNASVVYDDVELLKGINWRVREGENWALLGPNGSGKTTLLSLILADNPHSYTNDVRVFGKRRGSGETIWEIKKHIGLVSPDIQIHYHRHMTCHDVVCSGFHDSIGLYNACSDRQRRLVRLWMARLGLSDLVERKFDELSAGQQRMALVARAVVKHPRLMILDEPCQGLDPENRDIVLRTLDLIGRQGGSNLICVTHHLDEIPDSITHVLMLRNGRVVRNGRRSEILGA